MLFARPGDLVFKPRHQWHTFWNAGDAPARALEIISPGGFERYFMELGALRAAGGPPLPDRLAALCERYGLEMNMASAPDLVNRFGVRFPGPPPS